MNKLGFATVLEGMILNISCRLHWHANAYYNNFNILETQDCR